MDPRRKSPRSSTLAQDSRAAEPDLFYAIGFLALFLLCLQEGQAPHERAQLIPAHDHELDIAAVLRQCRESYREQEEQEAAHGSK